MKRSVSIEEISDGRLYGRNDMVKAGCGGCKGCSACCHGMGESIILDPYDVWRLTNGLQVSFAQLLEGYVEWNVVDGIILPNLRMGSNGACGFLNEEGRCRIHPYRPGVCRLFPLGRYYTGRKFDYFLQIHECPYPVKTKVKITKWLETPNLEQYDHYISTWHYFLEDVQSALKELEEETVKNSNLLIMQLFYVKPYLTRDFYSEFQERLTKARDILSIQ